MKSFKVLEIFRKVLYSFVCVVTSTMKIADKSIKHETAVEEDIYSVTVINYKVSCFFFYLFLSF